MSKKRQPPARGIKAREDQMIALATDLAEKRIRDGTASSQVLTHYLKAGTVRNQLELENLKHLTELTKAKTDSVRSSERLEEICNRAIDAMRVYSGNESEEDDEEL